MQIDTPYLTAWLKVEEGLVLGGARKCTKGHLTMGYGHKCTTEAERILSRTMTETDAVLILESDIDRACRGATAVFGLADIDKQRATALTAMVFQLGVGTVAKFRRFRHAVVCCHWADAAAEMIWRDPVRLPGIHTSWHDDTPARCERTAAIIRTGVLPTLP